MSSASPIPNTCQDCGEYEVIQSGSTCKVCLYKSQCKELIVQLADIELRIDHTDGERVELSLELVQSFYESDPIERIVSQTGSVMVRDMETSLEEDCTPILRRIQAITWERIRRLVRDLARQDPRLKAAISAPLKSSLIMVSVVAGGFVQDHLLQKEGFAPTRRIENLDLLECEVASCYAAHLLGRKYVLSDTAYVFPPKNRVFRQGSLLARGRIFFGASDHGLVHWIGQSSELFQYLRDFCRSDAVTLGSTTADVMVVIAYWRNPSKVHNLMLEGRID